jgi:choline kinase
VKIVILGAGQGKRLLPLTTDVPKALLDIHGRSLIARQVDAFVECGLKEFVVVTGYGAHLMEEALDSIAGSTASRSAPSTTRSMPWPTTLRVAGWRGPRWTATSSR